ncbi:MAG: PEP-CTERM sorting domain-containing protein, partial [Candidatus Omnitrophica bacterium]|nr:PEP-CTERM sorting domain-containing protein [Candidatus Omnitrophota bacterium]
VSTLADIFLTCIRGEHNVRNRLFSSLSILIAVGLTVISAQSAEATIFAYSDDNPIGHNAAGTFEEIAAQYDDQLQKFSWSASFSAGQDGNIVNGNLPDGFWLVVSDGPNPKDNVDEYAILYADGINDKITSYVYDGQNNSNSYQTSSFIKAYSNELSVTVANGIKTFSFSLDVTDINNFLNTPDWDGAQFADMVGIWFHPFVTGGNGPTYDDQWHLTSLPIEAQGWYDRENKYTHVVPEPATVLLFSSGLAGAAFRRRKRG